MNFAHSNIASVNYNLALLLVVVQYESHITSIGKVLSLYLGRPFDEGRDPKNWYKGIGLQ